MSIISRINGVVDRLVHKMEMSQTPVPGFIVGLSGTDSLIAFEILSQGLKRLGIGDRLYGVHYFTEGRRPDAFMREAIPWVRERYPEARLSTVVPLGGNQDPQRWADLQLRALYDINICPNMEIRLESHEEGRNYWVAGTINATEHALGKHSIGANAVSLQPIRSLWKSDVMEACVAIGVPEIIVDNAYLPDCMCGRDEIAAKHIAIIDEILRHQIDVTKHDTKLIMVLMQWVSDRKRDGGFRSRIPYIV